MHKVISFLCNSCRQHDVTMITINTFADGLVKLPNKLHPQKCIAYCYLSMFLRESLWWRHNDHDSASNHQPHECLFNRLFRRRSKKTSNSASLAFVWGIHRDRWIPRTNGQLRGKCFHLMTSSCLHPTPLVYIHVYWGISEPSLRAKHTTRKGWLGW